MSEHTRFPEVVTDTGLLRMHSERATLGAGLSGSTESDNGTYRGYATGLAYRIALGVGPTIIGLAIVIAHNQLWLLGLGVLSAGIAYAACHVYSWMLAHRCANCRTLYDNSPAHPSCCCPVCHCVDNPQVFGPDEEPLRITKTSLENEHDPVLKCAKTLLLLSVYDELDELTMAIRESDAMLRAKLRGVWYELEPPPEQLLRKLIAIIRARWHLARDVQTNASRQSKVLVITDRGQAVVTAKPPTANETVAVTLLFDRNDPL